MPIRTWSQNIIKGCFHILFFLVPLILTPWNYELFEYNKMMITYGITTIIAAAWGIQWLVTKSETSEKKTPLSQRSMSVLIFTLLLFLSSQVISTFFSIDPHVSWWGYYSRFNGGLLSIICYTLLFFAFISNISQKNIRSLFTTIAISSTLVCLYAVAEHMGIDKHLWVQDVQNRVFSTLGQPNWLAAYVDILIPLGIGITIAPSLRRDEKPVYRPLWQTLLWYTWTFLLYLTLIFTKSRSGLLGVWTGISILFISLVIISPVRSHIKRWAATFLISFFILHFLFGISFEHINRYTLPSLLAEKKAPQQAPPPSPDVLDVGVTESGNIRKIVWKGAIDIVKAYPWFGSGVETFAYAYYRHRPAEHNMTSEWDFLYNKAHNEYLNYAATTGLIGITTYLLFIISVVGGGLSLVYTLRHQDMIRASWQIALLSGWVTILVTNFFGFSVVIVQIFFYLIPAIVLVLSREESSHNSSASSSLSWKSKTGISVISIAAIYAIISLCRLWYADTIFARGYQENRSGSISQAYLLLHQALLINRREPLYYDELALTASEVSMALDGESSATLSSQLIKESLAASDIALSISPNNVNFWKNRARILYALAQTDETYLPQAYEAMHTASELSPTDPKVFYNLALVYNLMGKKEDAYAALKKAADLKPNYKEPFVALALFSERDKKPDLARTYLEYILKKIDPHDEDVKKKLDDLP